MHALGQLEEGACDRDRQAIARHDALPDLASCRYEPCVDHRDPPNAQAPGRSMRTKPCQEQERRGQRESRIWPFARR